MRRLALLSLALTLTACATDDPDSADDPAVVSLEPVDVATEAELEAPAEPINLNTATDEEFATIPGVGDRMIHEFEEYRPYTSLAQFRREIGKYVDADQVAEYERYVFVPVDPNASDAETMGQLPGVGPEEAAALEAGRPYASAEAFLDRYAQDVAGADRGLAALYLASE